MHEYLSCTGQHRSFLKWVQAIDSGQKPVPEKNITYLFWLPALQITSIDVAFALVSGQIFLLQLIEYTP